MTAPVAIVNFMQYEGWEWGKIAAAGMLVMLPVVIFTAAGPQLSRSRPHRGRPQGLTNTNVIGDFAQ